jgi:hypothetical protein
MSQDDYDYALILHYYYLRLVHYELIVNSSLGTDQNCNCVRDDGNGTGLNVEHKGIGYNT